MAYVVEGGLFPADLLDKIAAGEGDGQRPADFARNGGSPSARMADAIQAAFSAARAHWDSYQYRLQTSQRAVARLTREDWVIKLAELLGYGELNRLPSPLEAAGLTYRMYATAGQSEYAPPVHIVGRDQPLDRRETQNRRSPHALVQEYLNNSDALWGIVTNGDRLRLLRDSARFTRPTYIEFDLKGIVESNQYAEFALLYRLLHRSRLPADGKPPNDCLLERYYQAGLDSHGRVRDKLRDGVERALLALGNGFLAHPDSDALRESVALRDGGGARLTAQDYYRQLLRLVYRLLFLMTAEERKMLLDPDNGDPALYAIYDAHYSVSGLRDRAERRFGDDRVSSDLWQGLKRTLALFREEDAARAIGLRALNGELFAESACPDLESAGISNYDLLRAMHNLSTFLDDDDGRGRRRRARRSAVRRRVHYAGIDVEEFGSVYESLLDFHPRIAPGITQAAPPEFGFAAGSERKQTGSYYTPPELVKELVNSALVPVMQERIDAARSADAKIAALLDISVCDPASGSGHFVLAAARRIATQLARLRSGDAEPPPAAYRAALREVIRRCIYAVDKNPLAVDLCKVALWIEGHEPGLPLSFLDHRIKCGDSLVGVDSLTALDEGIPNDAYKHIIGDDKAAAALWRKQNRQELKGNVPFSFADSAADSSLSDDFADLAAMADDSPRQVHEKEARYERIRAPQTDWWTNKTACDLWTAAFFMPKRPPDPRGIDTLPTTGVLRRHIANSAATSGELIGSAVDISAKNRFFHWRLEFPEVFHKGGFDVVLGNPPWERIKLQEKEFFASRDSAIAEAPNKAARARLISALPDNNPALAAEFAQARRAAESASLFARASGRYPLAARGDINTYSIFAETARRILNPTGRAGLIVPSGIATDDTTKVFFADAVNSNALVSLYDFENRQGIFPGVHRSYKFCLLTLSGERQRAPQAEFAFFLHDTAQLAEPARRFTLTAADFALFNPNTRTCPVFRTDRDMEIARKMYHRAGVFWREAKGGVEESNPWGVAFSRMFDVSNDSGLFRQREELTASGWLLDGNVFTRGDERYIPLYEAKMFQQYDHRYATFEGVSPPDIRKGNARSLTSEDKADVDALVLPRYWVHEKEVANRLDNVSQLADNITQPNPTQPNPTQPNPTHQALRHSERLPNWHVSRFQKYRQSDRPQDEPLRNDSPGRAREFGNNYTLRFVVFRGIAAPTNERTAIAAVVQGSAMDKAQVIHIDFDKWLQAFRGITTSTNERTMIAGNLPASAVGNNAPVVEYEYAPSVASLLVLANMNSIPLDWATRLSIGGVNMNFFIVKQLPILPPEEYLEDALPGVKYAELVVPRALELTYTSWELQPFAADLGYEGAPFAWDDDRRHKLQCELDAVFAHMYGLERAELEWVLDAQPPSESFPGLKRNEIQRFGEYRTQRYVLAAYDMMARGERPNID